MLAFRPEETAPTAGGASAHRTQPAIRGDVAPAGASGATPAASHQPERSREAHPRAASSPPEARTLTPENWHQVVAGLKLGGISAQLASHCFVESWDGRRLVLGLDPEGEALRVGGRAGEKLRQTLEAWLGSPLVLEIEAKAEAVETPARRSAREARERRETALREMKEDPVVRMLEEDFDGRLQEESLELTKKQL